MVNNVRYVSAEEIKGVKCDKESQETVISWTRDDSLVTVCTSDPTTVTKLKNVMFRDPASYKCYYHENDVDKESGYPACYFFQFSKSLITYRVEKSSPMMSAEERMAVAKRLNKNS